MRRKSYKNSLVKIVYHMKKHHQKQERKRELARKKKEAAAAKKKAARSRINTGLSETIKNKFIAGKTEPA